MSQLYRNRIIRGGYPKSSKSNQELLAGQLTILIDGQVYLGLFRPYDGTLWIGEGLMHAFVCFIRLFMVWLPYPSKITYSTETVSRYCHSMALRQVSSSTNYYEYSFFQLAIVKWNALPQCVAILWRQGLQDRSLQAATFSPLDPLMLVFN